MCFLGYMDNGASLFGLCDIQQCPDVTTVEAASALRPAITEARVASHSSSTLPELRRVEHRGVLNFKWSNVRAHQIATKAGNDLGLSGLKPGAQNHHTAVLC